MKVSIVMFGMPADQHTEGNTPSYGAKLDMVKIRTTKLAILIYMKNIGEWRDFRLIKGSLFTSLKTK